MERATGRGTHLGESGISGRGSLSELAGRTGVPGPSSSWSFPLLSLPNGISRWSDGSYFVLVAALLAVTVLPLVPAVWEWIQVWLGTNLAPRVLVALALMAGLVVGYFQAGLPAGLALLIAQAALLLSIAVLFGVERSGEAGRLWLPLGFLLFLALSFFNAFAFTYPLHAASDARDGVGGLSHWRGCSFRGTADRASSSGVDTTSGGLARSAGRIRPGCQRDRSLALPSRSRACGRKYYGCHIQHSLRL